MRRALVENVAQRIAVAALYLAAAKAGLALASPSPQVSLVWPASGVALAAVLLLGRRVWPGIALGAFLANVTTAEPPLTAAGIALGNTLEALAAAALLERLRFRASLDRLRDVIALVVCGAGLSTLVAATIGALSLCAGGVEPWPRFGGLWAAWWLGDAGGDLVVTPLLLAWAARPWRSWSAREGAELAALALAACGVGLVVFGPWPDALAGHLPFAYLTFPVLIATALRHGVPGAAVVVLLTSVFALAGAVRGSGPFARDASGDALLLVLAYTSVLALTGLVLGALALERRRSERQRAAVQATASALAAPGTLAQASRAVLRATCRHLGWELGAFWGVDRGAGVLRCLALWSRPDANVAELLAALRAQALAPGEGLAGRVWLAGEPVRIADVAREPELPFAAAPGGAAFHAGLGFPIWSGGQVEGVIELFGGDRSAPDDSLLQLMGTVCVQLGQFLERSRAEAALQQSQGELAERADQLAESQRYKDEFLVMLAHELRNPLAPLAAAADILAEARSPEPAVRRAREIVERQLEQLVKLIDHLLDVSRVSRRKVRLERAGVDLEAVVERALQASRAAIEARGHALELALPAERIVLHADAARLAQALANVLDNAAKFTDPGGRIRLEARYREGEVEICVHDTGVGIEPKLLPRVFDLFFQSESAAGRSHGGLGTGLALVRSLVEMHGGEVGAASEGSGHGSVFTLRLPARRAARAEPPPERPANAHRALRILLVEDNRDSADALSHLLGRRGHETHVARDGFAGLAEARALRPDVVLLDIGLPGLDGYEVARRLRESGDAEGILLVALSGYGEEAHRRRARQAGFDHYLVKPVKVDELTRIFTKVAAPSAER